MTNDSKVGPRALFNVRLRSIGERDYSFIKSLAATYSTFTIPSDYMLWLFSRFHPDHSRVLEQQGGELKGYLLAMPTSEPQNGIAVWQVAATESGRPFALEYFADYLRDLAVRTGAVSISFTLQEDENVVRLVRMLADKFFRARLLQVGSVPAGQSEHEFMIRIPEGLTEGE